jgi:FtsP/CotA-like multicopper oxidase with cupredoxin domain
MDDDRKNGRGIVIEYANRTVSQPDETIPIVFGMINGGQGGFNRWTINGASFDENTAPRKLRKGNRHRLVSDNRTHPIHPHRNSFELTNVNGKPMSGVLKDVVLVKGF